MRAPLIVALPGNKGLAADLATRLDGELAPTTFHRFPDGERYIRFDTPLAGRSLVLVCTFDRPDEKFLTLAFVADSARDLGARRVGLVAPYLAYMRQDKSFKPGEAVTSVLFARLLSRSLDWLVTIDPHLHRLGALDAIYEIPTQSLHAAPLIVRWIVKQIPRPLLIGPDVESEQWVGAIAAECGAPHIVLEKVRHGDRAVEISVPDIGRWPNRTPVLIDDIISSGHTMIEALSQFKQSGMTQAICVGVHAVFGNGAYDALRAAGPARIVTTDTIPHETNDIDVTALLVEPVLSLS